MNLRIYKIGTNSRVSSGALLAAIKTKKQVTIVRHHPDVNVDDAIAPAVLGIRIKLHNDKVRAMATLLWSLVIGLTIPWPPIFYAMAPEVRGAIWIGTGLCFLSALVLYGRSILDGLATTRFLAEDKRWPVVDGPTRLPSNLAWREGD